jgi:hypothetical protein
MTSRTTCKRPTRPPARFKERELVIIWNARDPEHGHIYHVFQYWPRTWDRSRSGSRYRYLIVRAENQFRYVDEQYLREP